MVNNKRKNDTKQAAAVVKADGQRTILPLKYDVIFAKFFADERNKDELVGLLKAILKLPDDEYELLDVSDPRLHPERVGDKYAVIDLKLRTKSGRIIHIEMQIQVTPELANRIVFYNAKLLSGQLLSGHDYREIKQTITILITDEDFLKGVGGYHHRFAYSDLDAGVELTDLTEIHTVELRKLPPKPDGTALYDWAELIAAETEEKMETIVERNPQMRETVVKLWKLSAEEEARELLELREKQLRDEATAMRWAREQGEQLGARQKAEEVARNAVSMGVDTDTIAKLTGLTREEIEALR
jgi:predicted transposase/invertase (TIGR01784 family)